MTEQTVASGPKGDRIAKLLARAGVASRREIERMIAEGRVALDGVVLDTPATILTSLGGVTVDGRPVAAPQPTRLFVYHKPNGLLVTERDPAGRATIYDRLPKDLPRTVPVGRLDLNTEGLLLLTTDGGLKRQLELPATGVERTYRARAYGEVTQAQLEELIEGVEVQGVRYGAIDANLERRTGANVWIELTLTEGKNREVRHVLEHLGLQVGRLIRTRYGPFVLGDLPPGAVGEVKQHDLVAFAKTLGGARRAKGADLQSLVEVEARKPAAAPAPPAEPVRAPSPSPDRGPRASRTARPAAGWGSRARPSRPSDARSDRADEERTPRARRPDADAGASDRPRDRPVRSEQRVDRTRARTAGDPRDARDDRPRADQGGGGRAGTLSPAKPAKGPAGGRGRPPRPSDSEQRGPRGPRNGGGKPRGGNAPGGPPRGRR